MNDLKTNLSFLFLLCSVSLFAQLKEPLLPYLKTLPAFPLSEADAGAKCWNEQNNQCNTDVIPAAFINKSMMLSTQLNGMTPQSSTTMPDTSYVSKLKNMTPDEQRAWALQYAAQQQQAAASQPLKVRGAEEQNFSKVFHDCISGYVFAQDSSMMSWKKLTDEFDAQMKLLNDKRVAQINACPVVMLMDGKGFSPACVKQIESDYRGWISSYYMEWLKKSEDFIAGEEAKFQLRFGKGETALAKTNYLANPSNSSFTTEAITLQQNILSGERIFAGFITDTWSKGCVVHNEVTQSTRRI